MSRFIWRHFYRLLRGGVRQDLIRADRRYLWCLHPHAVLADGWHSIIARSRPERGRFSQSPSPQGDPENKVGFQLLKLDF